MDSATNRNKTNIFAQINGFISSNAVALFFILFCLATIYFSKLSIPFILSQLTTRITRNLFIVLALIIPVIAGMGLNFSITIGAMAAQTAMIWVTHWGISGIGGMGVCFLIATPLAILLGTIIGKFLNKTRGQEMIASMILGFFADGIYQLIFLFLTGKIIPMKDETLILNTGVGVKNTIDLMNGLKYSIDGVLEVPFFAGLGIICAIMTVVKAAKGLNAFKRTRGIEEQEHGGTRNTYSRNHDFIIGAVYLIVTGTSFFLNSLPSEIADIKLPMLTVLLIAALYVFNGVIFKTKLGQEFRAVGQDIQIAKTSGIDVDRVRVLAIVLSTTFAAWGQLILLQNMGTINTYGSHTQVGFFAVGALVMGGASVSKANSRQALLGVILFHILFIASPMAGKNIFGQPQIGEYFRVFITYGVIGLSTALHAWNRQRELKANLAL